jgi:hypothetical protein
MHNARHISVKPLRGISPEQELNALASVYAFLLKCRDSKKAAHPGGPDDAKEIKSVRARTILHQDP